MFVKKVQNMKTSIAVVLILFLIGLPMDTAFSRRAADPVPVKNTVDVLDIAYKDSSDILLEISQYIEAEVLLDKCKERGIVDTLAGILLNKKDKHLETLMNAQLDLRRTEFKDESVFGDYETALFLTVPAQERGFFFGYIEGMNSDETEDKTSLCEEGMFLADMVLRNQ